MSLEKESIALAEEKLSSSSEVIFYVPFEDADEDSPWYEDCYFEDDTSKCFLSVVPLQFSDVIPISRRLYVIILENMKSLTEALF